MVWVLISVVCKKWENLSQDIFFSCFALSSICVCCLGKEHYSKNTPRLTGLKTMSATLHSAVIRNNVSFFSYVDGFMLKGILFFFILALCFNHQLCGYNV